MSANNLFIIKSPFQTLCAYSIIQRNKGLNYQVLLLKDQKNANKAEAFLEKQKCRYSIFDHTGGLKSIKRRLKDYASKFDNVYVGDYFNIVMYAMAIFTTKKGGHIKYLDDGTATLLMMPPVSLPRYYYQKNRRIKYWGLNICRALKFVTETLCTIYELNNTKWRIEKNDLSFLSSNSVCDKKGCYIIGTNSSKIISKEDYCRVLDYTIKLIKEYFPKEKIYYCPHRADEYQYNDYCHQHGVELFETQISVEVDFVERMIYPAMVVGYGSTALLSLKEIFPKSEILSIEMPLTGSYSERWCQINSYYKKMGINIINMSDND